MLENNAPPCPHHLISAKAAGNIPLPEKQSPDTNGNDEAHAFKNIGTAWSSL